MRFKFPALLIFTLCATVFTHAQNVGINNTTPDASAMLDIVSSDKGLLIPRVALVSATSNVPIGAGVTTSLLVYNTATAGASPNQVTPGFYYWSGSKWVRLIGGTGATGDAWTTTGNAGTVDGTNFIGTTDDVPFNIRVNNQKAGRIDNVLSNSFYGFGSGQTNTTGSGNAFFGRSSGNSNLSGSNNTFLGNGSGFSNTTGYSNVAIGANALRSNLTVNGLVAIGDSALRSNTSGSFNTAVGSKSGMSATNSSHNTFIGFETGKFTANGFNTFVGSKAGSNANGLNSCFFGYQSGHNSSGTNNSFFGYNAGSVNTTGNTNNFFGSEAGNSNTTGGQNSFFGSVSGFNNTTGSSNVFVGGSSGVNNTIGDFNSYFGRLSGSNNVTGTLQTMAGYGAIPGGTNLSNATAIGAFAQVNSSNSLVLGSISGVNSATATVNVGIGTTTPLDRLHVVGKIRMVDGTQGNGKVLTSDANGTATWQTATNGTVTSVGVSLPAIFSVSNSPLTSAGTITATLINQSANKVFAGPASGAAAVPTFRTLVAADIPALTSAQTNAWELAGNVGTNSSTNFVGTSDSVDLVIRTNNLERINILSSGNVGIGTNVPSDKLHVAGNIRMVDGNEAIGKIMMSDANGKASWQNVTVIGGWSLTGNAGTVDGINFIGTTDNVPFNIKAGNQKAGRIEVNIGTANTFYGYLTGIANTGMHNCFFGYTAGQANTSGGHNSFFGNEAGKLTSTGQRNSFYGCQSGDANTTGSENCFYGNQSGGTNTTGFHNTYYGFNTTGSATGNKNTAVGHNAITNGTRSTSLGANATINGTLTNATAIGSQARVDTDNAIVLGSINGINGATATVNLGIGTTAPGERLEVAGKLYLNNSFSATNAALVYKDDTDYLYLGPRSGSTSNGAAISLFGNTNASTGNANGIDVNTNVGTAMRISSGGNVGVGPNMPIQKFEVNGPNIAAATSGSAANGIMRLQPSGTSAALDMGVTGSPVHAWIQSRDKNTYASNYPLILNPNGSNVGIGTTTPGGQFELSLDQGRKPSSSAWTVTSDARLKTIEGAYTKGLDEILQLEPIVYHYKNSGERKFEEEVLNKENVGFSAQDVQRIFPEAVGTDPDGFLNFNMHAILVAYVNAFKKQQSQIESLRSENQALKDSMIQLQNEWRAFILENEKNKNNSTTSASK